MGIQFYLAGNVDGFPLIIPELLIKDYNVLLSYTHPTGPKMINRTIGVKMLMKEGIKDMDLFLVGPEKDNIMQDVIANNKPNMLFNYMDGKKAVDRYKDILKPKKLFVDSGAFSAWTSGRAVDVDSYINWINDRAEHIDLYGQVDSIPGDIIKGATPAQVEEAADKTWQNYLYMRPKMKNPDGLLYTFHVGEPFKYLEQALEWRDENGKPIPYIALGGMVGKSKPIKHTFLTGCYRIIRKSSNPTIKTHAFGMTSVDILTAYPITSCDSTSWIMTGANGGIITDIGRIAVSDQKSVLPTHYSHLSKENQKGFEDVIAEFGFTLDELRHSRDKRIIFNARYLTKQMETVKHIPGPIRKSLF